MILLHQINKRKNVISVKSQLLFKNNSLTYWDGLECAHPFLNGCNVMYSKGKQAVTSG